MRIFGDVGKKMIDALLPYRGTAAPPGMLKELGRKAVIPRAGRRGENEISVLLKLIEEKSTRSVPVAFVRYFTLLTARASASGRASAGRVRRRRLRCCGPRGFFSRFSRVRHLQQSARL